LFRTIAPVGAGNGVSVVTGVFSIPLDAPKAASHASKSDGQRQPLPLREFISGEENALARVAADDLLRGGRYNPLIFCGEPGTGKSHLCRGLVARWRQEHPKSRVLVIHGADFARQYAAAVDADAVTDFRRKYRRLDLLLLENLPEVAAKTPAQQELITTLDHLLSHDRRVLVTSTSLPAKINKLAAGLASRLSSGLIVPLTRPAAKPRRTILQRLAEAYHVHFTPATLDALARQLEATVPELNHVVVTLAGGAANGDKIDVDAVQNYLAEDETDSTPTLRSITSRVARYFKLKSADLKGSTRRQAVVRARGVAMLLARQLTGKSLDEVGRHYGGRDHTTVLHACRKTESLLADDPATRHAVEEIKSQLVP
jgi:chromosomal replication initiator protein